MSNNTEQRPEIPMSGIVFGEIIYWTTIVATIVVIVGSILTFVGTGHHLDPSYLLSSIWEGKEVDDIWKGGVGTLPDGHWYLNHLDKGDGLTTAGLALGVFSVIPAILAAAILLIKKDDFVFGGFALLAALITILSVLL